ncbi:glycosyltransferase, partial [Bacteroidota bacterium]|nr:glycosyltransferase [Bacteroidota bacterium]
MTKKSLSIVYHWFPHYRYFIFNEISKNFNLKLIGDKKSRYNNLKLMDLKSFNFFKIQNIWFGPFLYQLGLIKIIKKNNCSNYIFLADWKFISTWIILIFFKRNNLFIGWTHGISDSDFFFIKYAKRRYYNLFDEILTYNEQASNKLNSLKIKSRPIYNSLQNFPYLPKKSGKENDWIFVGRIIKERLLSEFITKINKSDLGRTKFHIIGPCDFKKDLEKLIEINGLKNQVILYGAIYDLDQIINISKSCKYFIHPSDVGLSALLAINLNLILYTHDNFKTHKPEIESAIQ